MKFLVDNQLPMALVRFFAEQGHVCEHVLDLKMETATDAEIWRYAALNGMVVISKDDDFVTIARTSASKGQLIYVRLGNCRNQILVAAFQEFLPQITAALESDEQIVELR